MDGHYGTKEQTRGIFRHNKAEATQHCSPQTTSDVSFLLLHTSLSFRLAQASNHFLKYFSSLSLCGSHLFLKKVLFSCSWIHITDISQIP